MNIQRMAATIREIERLTLAQKWFQEYRACLTPEDRKAFRIRFELVTASLCTGGKEAREQIEAVAHHHIIDIVAHAIRDVENTIELHIAALKEEIQ